MNCPECGSKFATSRYGYFPIKDIEKEVYTCRECGHEYRVTYQQFIEAKERELAVLKLGEPEDA